MKKLILIFMFATLSCSSDDNSDNSLNAQLPRTNNNVIGNWVIKGGTSNGGEFQNYQNDCPMLSDYQQFLANGNLIFIEHNESCEVNETETSGWSLEGNILIVDNPQPFNDYEYTIESLTADKMILTITVNNPDGVSIQRTYLERQ